MIKMIDSYFEYLTTHPTMLNSIGLWTVTMVFYYFILIKYRQLMIEGSRGENSFWEMPEQWGYIWLYVSGPITAYSAYFNSELPSWVWWFNVGIAGYTIGGRWIFEWALAIRAGSTKVEHETKTTATLEKTEVTKKSE